MIPTWTAHDSALLRELADEYPATVGNSEVLATLVETEIG